MTGPEVAALTASAFSVALAIFAIGLSLAFFFKASSLTERANDAATRIELSVNQLNSVFDAFRTETFTMMSDTLRDFRTYALTPTRPDSDDVEKLTAQRIREVTSTFDRELADVLARQELADQATKTLGTEVYDLFKRAMEESQAVRTETTKLVTREWITRRLSTGQALSVAQIEREIKHGDTPFTWTDAFNAIFDMWYEGVLIVDPPPYESGGQRAIVHGSLLRTAAAHQNEQNLAHPEPRGAP